MYCKTIMPRSRVKKTWVRHAGKMTSIYKADAKIRNLPSCTNVAKYGFTFQVIGLWGSISLALPHRWFQHNQM